MHVECDVAISVIKQLFNAVRSPDSATTYRSM